MNRTSVPTLVAFTLAELLALPAVLHAAGAAAEKPNLIFVLTDDKYWLFTQKAQKPRRSCVQCAKFQVIADH